jgi:hypothetical protein
MNPLITSITNENIALQRLKPSDGPTAMAVAFTGLKVLLLKLIQTNAGNLNYITAWNLLNKDGMSEFDSLLDYYEQEQDKDYDESFDRLKGLVDQAVLLLL